MQLIDGKAISELVKQEIAAEVAGIVAKSVFLFHDYFSIFSYKNSS